MLETIAILQGLDREALARLGRGCSWRRHHRGAEIVSAAAASSDVYLIAAGRVRVTIFSASGREVAFRELGRGDSFGELSAIDGQSRSASVVALEACEISVIPRARFWALLEEHPVVAANVLKALAALVRDLTARIVETTTLTVPERVRSEVVRMAREAGVAGNAASIASFPTQADIASRIGSTREAVSRELSRMTSLGLIERNGRRLVVPDFNELLAAVSEVD